MFVSIEEEPIPFHLHSNGSTDVVKSVLVESNFRNVDELSPESGMVESHYGITETPANVGAVSQPEKDQLEQNLKDLEGEIESLKTKLAYQDEKRRASSNKILDIKGNIRVFCRVRPFLSTAKKRIQQPLSIDQEKVVIRYGGTRKEFGFDQVFPQESSQEDVFAEVEPILRSALDGHNVCIIAYGQTGTGKTYTMDGTNESPGIIPRVLSTLFSQASSETAASFTFSISMVEVYLGSLRDLLAPKQQRSYGISRCNPTIQIDSKGSVEIEGLTEVQVSNLTKATWWYTKGRRVRSTSWTSVNEASSRSHCLTRITIHRLGDTPGAKSEVSKVWMVDLGGSERLLKTGATGQTMDEGRAINLSLSALGDVIAALRRKKNHVPYRNSKLTQILRDSLGDGSKVMMFVHVSPYEEDVGETTCSVSFAKRARAVEFTRELSEDLKKQKEKKIAELEDEMKEAEEECEKLQKQIRKIEFLLAEYKKISSTSSQNQEEEVKNPASPKESIVEALETPKASERAVVKNDGTSLPRFMNSTVASRQRKSVAERQVTSRVRSFRSETKSSIHISGSQSNSYSDPRFKGILRSSNKKPRYGESECTLTGDAKCDVLHSNSLTPGRTVTPKSNLRPTVFNHRRRMSDVL
ncbi:OLC1v1000688C1 [Oldenlandia corymbosa var. corymbosa]|uniref:OLC1v1000688C1 n=1 Tax=Oldenlandia corymbosa var. corymbosa TaxID=529605 RepID=A0AAV1D4D6_OLDCO|nr:OLC1v1000688C1 [Oldenlandia corymbosa var. corymbosa]